MRVRGYVTVELIFGACLVGGIVWTSSQGLSFAQASREKTPQRAPVVRPAVDGSGLIKPLQVANPFHNRLVTPLHLFEGVDDQILLAPLREGAEGADIRTTTFNLGGSSISLRLQFKNGARAAFKPNQTNPQTVPRREVAAYRIDRLLHLNSVPPAIARAFRTRDVMNSVVPGSRQYLPRMRNEIITQWKDGESWVVGELSWWIPVIKLATIDGYRIDKTEGIVTWRRYLTVGHEIPNDAYFMAQQISNIVLFDMVINNSDRWSGGNARASEDGRVLFFMDNTLAFGVSDTGAERTQTYFKRCQKFSRRLVQRLRDITLEEVRAAVTHGAEPFRIRSRYGFLSENEIASVLKRRDYALAYIDDLIAEHGEDRVLIFP